jgi:uncharacterized protein (TIGR03437 family)
VISYRIVLASILLLCGGLLSGQTVSFLRPESAFSTGGFGAIIAAADFNGDGNMDIVYVAPGFDIPYTGVLLGNGGGSFRNITQFSANLGMELLEHIGYVVVGDFNGDGKPDVAFSDGGAVVVYLGVGDGTFTGPFGFPACIGRPIAADVNDDGKQDLICGSSVLLSNGDGTFSSIPATLAGNAVLAANFNGDGHIDLLLADASGQLAVVLGKGDGTFGPSLPVSGLLLSGSQTPALAQPNTFQSIQVGDFNGDGLIDLVGPSADGTSIVVLPGRGDGNFGEAIVTAGSTGPVTAVADFNRDGKLDLLALSKVVENSVEILAGNGDGTFRYPVSVGLVAPSCRQGSGYTDCVYSPGTILVADFNSDGLPDIASGLEDTSPVLAEWSCCSEVSVVLNDSPGNGFTATGVSSATWTWPVGSGSMVSTFGVNLAPVEASAGPGPWPTTLGGIRLHVQGQNGVDSLAPLLYVSPGQINYVLESTDPFAWVGIELVGAPFVAQGMIVPIIPIAPGLFTLDGGLAAATAVRVAPNGTQTFVSALVPIDLSGDPVYLSLYGTGFDLATTAASSCAIAGQTLPATYAGPQMQTVGLDQINVLLPKTLAGTGETSVTCSFGSTPRTSNAAELTIQ